MTTKTFNQASRLNKTLQACDHCRSLKIKCIPSSKHGVCQKCLQSDRPSCQHSEGRGRPTKYRKINSEARIAALEKKLDAVITKSEAAWSPARVPDTTGLKTPGEVVVNHLTGILSADEYNAVPEVLQSCAFTLESAEQYMVRFRTMSAYFPFVVLPSHVSLLGLAHEKPFLCLAIMSVASPLGHENHKQLEAVFRRALLQKVTIDGHRTLELLQALLVYIAWYQFFSTSKRDQSYMLIQTAISMCVDLGLDLSPTAAMSRPAGLHLEHYHKHTDKNARHDEFFSTGARRAYLGCHYLATQVSSVFGKPIRIYPTEYMYQCAQSLVDDLEYETDRLVLLLTRTQQLADNYHNLLLPARASLPDESSFRRIRVHMDALQTKISDLYDDNNNNVPDNRHVQLASKMAIQYSQIYACDLNVVNPLLGADRTNPVPSSIEGSPSSARTEILSLCLESAIRLIRLTLNISTADYPLLSYIQWMPIIHTSIYLYRLTLGLSSVPEWNPRIAEQSIDLGDYLSTIATRLNGVTKQSPPYSQSSSTEERPKTSFFMLGHIFEKVRRTWERLRRLAPEERKKDQEKVHETEFPSENTNTRKTSQEQIEPVTVQPAVTTTVRANECPAKYFWYNQSHALDLDMDFNTNHHNHDTGPEDEFYSTGAHHSSLPTQSNNPVPPPFISGNEMIEEADWSLWSTDLFTDNDPSTSTTTFEDPSSSSSLSLSWLL